MCVMHVRAFSQLLHAYASCFRTLPHSCRTHRHARGEAESRARLGARPHPSRPQAPLSASRTSAPLRHGVLAGRPPGDALASMRRCAVSPRRASVTNSRPPAPARPSLPPWAATRRGACLEERHPLSLRQLHPRSSRECGLLRLVRRGRGLPVQDPAQLPPRHRWSVSPRSMCLCSYITFSAQLLSAHRRSAGLAPSRPSDTRLRGAQMHRFDWSPTA